MTLMPKRILVTGGAGFIGSAVAREIIHATPHEVVVLARRVIGTSCAPSRTSGRLPDLDRGRLSQRRSCTIAPRLKDAGAPVWGTFHFAGTGVTTLARVRHTGDRRRAKRRLPGAIRRVVHDHQRRVPHPGAPAREFRAR